MRSIRPTVRLVEEFPCRCGGSCLCQGPPGRRPRRARIFVKLPEEPPQLTPAAARTLLSILQKAVDKQKREAEADVKLSALILISHFVRGGISHSGEIRPPRHALYAALCG